MFENQSAIGIIGNWKLWKSSSKMLLWEKIQCVQALDYLEELQEEDKKTFDCL